MHVCCFFCISSDLGRSSPSCAFQRGFTAIELMVTVAILAVLTTLAAPSFTPLMERWRVRQAAEELQSTIYCACSETVKRGGSVTVVTNTGDWFHGWTANHPRSPSPLPHYVASSKTTLYVDRWGMSGVANAAEHFEALITAEGKDKTAASSQRLCIPLVGRIKRQDAKDDCNDS